MAKKIPGTRVLDETFKQTVTAVAVPPNHPQSLAFAVKFLNEAISNGTLRKAYDNNGLKDSPIRTQTKESSDDTSSFRGARSASPKSIELRTGANGFRARCFASPRNDVWRGVAPTSVQLHKYKAFHPCRTGANGAIKPVESRGFRADARKSGLAHRLLNCFSVNDDCRPTDCQGQCWRRHRDQATSPRRFGAVIGTISHESSCISVFDRA